MARHACTPLSTVASFLSGSPTDHPAPVPVSTATSLYWLPSLLLTSGPIKSYPTSSCCFGCSGPLTPSPLCILACVHIEHIGSVGSCTCSSCASSCNLCLSDTCWCNIVTFRWTSISTAFFAVLTGSLNMPPSDGTSSIMCSPLTNAAASSPCTSVYPCRAMSCIATTESGESLSVITFLISMSPTCRVPASSTVVVPTAALITAGCCSLRILVRYFLSHLFTTLTCAAVSTIGPLFMLFTPHRSLGASYFTCLSAIH